MIELREIIGKKEKADRAWKFNDDNDLKIDVAALSSSVCLYIKQMRIHPSEGALQKAFDAYKRVLANKKVMVCSKNRLTLSAVSLTKPILQSLTWRNDNGRWGPTNITWEQSRPLDYERRQWKWI